MDQAVIKYYRKILSEGFKYAGTLENPTIVLDAVGENIRICDHVGTDSLRVFIKVKNGAVDDIKYMCMCDPTTNVAVEILCILLSGRPVESLEKITPKSFLQVLGDESEDLSGKARGLIELVRKVVERHKVASRATK